MGKERKEKKKAHHGRFHILHSLKQIENVRQNAFMVPLKTRICNYNQKRDGRRMLCHRIDMAPLFSKILQVHPNQEPLPQH